jgi:hypothetical protein
VTAVAPVTNYAVLLCSIGLTEFFLTEIDLETFVDEDPCFKIGPHRDRTEVTRDTVTQKTSEVVEGALDPTSASRLPGKFKIHSRK